MHVFIGHLMFVAQKVAKEQGLSPGGFRLVHRHIYEDICTLLNCTYIHKAIQLTVHMCCIYIIYICVYIYTLYGNIT
jgi:hypothetical protein